MILLTDNPMNAGLVLTLVLLPMQTWKQKPIFIKFLDSYAGAIFLDTTIDSEKHPRYAKIKMAIFLNQNPTKSYDNTIKSQNIGAFYN